MSNIPAAVASWRHYDVGTESYAPLLARGAFSESDGTFLVSGSGDMGPVCGAGSITSVKNPIGTPPGMIRAVVVPCSSSPPSTGMA